MEILKLVNMRKTEKYQWYGVFIKGFSEDSTMRFWEDTDIDRGEKLLAHMKEDGIEGINDFLALPVRRQQKYILFGCDPIYPINP